MAAPVYQGETFVLVSPGTSVTLNKPTGLAEGDLMLAVCVSDGSGLSATQWSTAESGWTKAGEDGNGTTDVKVALFYKVATASEAASFQFSHSSSDYLTGWMLHITGADTSSPFNVSFVGTTGSVTNSLAITAGTTTVDDCLCLAVAAFDGSDTGGLNWSGGSWVETAQRRNPNGGSVGVDGGWALLTQATAGAVATPTCSTFLGVSDGMSGYFVAISPPVASGNITHWNAVALADISSLNGVTAANISAINEITF